MRFWEEKQTNIESVVYGLKPTRFDKVLSSLQSLLGGCSDYVLKYEKGFAWSLCCDMLLDICTCCQSCSWTLSLVGATASVIFVTTTVLSQQTYVCRDKQVSVTKKLHLLLRQSMLVKNDLLQQTYFCHSKTFVVRNLLLSWQTHPSSWQKCACRNRTVRDKHVFVMTNLLWWQKWYLWQPLPLIEHRLLSTILATLAARSAFTWINYNLHA